MRPTKLTPECALTLINARQQGFSIKECAKLSGIAESSIKAWIAPKPIEQQVFALAWRNCDRQADLRAIDKIAEELRAVYPQLMMVDSPNEMEVVL